VRELQGLGFRATEAPFEYSTLPGRFATPLSGALGLIVVGAAGALAVAGDRHGAVLVAWLGSAAIAAAGWWLARFGVLSAPLLRARGVNLEFTKEGETPGVWLAAHLDSKSQPVPALVRSAGILVQVAGLLLALVLSAAGLAGVQVHDAFWAVTGLVTLAGAIPVVMSMTGDHSPGALDNASGVAAVVAAARALGDRPGVGVLLTDAEEMGLAGARAWARNRALTTVLNCDGVDDSGVITVMHSGGAERVLDAVARAASATGTRAEMSRLFPGILTDSVAFADAGHRSVTFSFGSIVSFARVHTRGDNLDRLTGAGIAPTAALMAATVRSLERNAC